MSSNSELKQRLVAGKNETKDGFSKYAQTQFLDNLTKEQYAGATRPTLSIFNQTKDTLNPNLNSAFIRERLMVIEHYKFRYGEAHTYWVHQLLGKTSRNIFKYKYNYLLKAFLAYQVYAKYAQYRHMNEMTFLTSSQRAELTIPIFLNSAVLAGTCLLI